MSRAAEIEDLVRKALAGDAAAQQRLHTALEATWPTDADVVRAATASGTPSHQEFYGKLNKAVSDAIAADIRFQRPASPRDCGSSPICCAWAIDILLTGKDYEAVVCMPDQKLFRIGFSYDEKADKATLNEGELKATVRTTVYSHLAAERLDQVRAAEMENAIRCHQPIIEGVRVAGEADWRQGETVSFVYLPEGKHNVTAGFRKGSVTMAVVVDKDTVAACQADLDMQRSRDPIQRPYGCVDHDEKAASVRLPSREKMEAGHKDFSYIDGKGVMLKAEATKLGADNVNGGIHWSWSPSFFTDAAYAKSDCMRCATDVNDCKCREPLLAIRAGERGSAENPARITGVAFQLGTLTNKPAFRAMPPVKASDKTEEVIAKVPEKKVEEVIDPIKAALAELAGKQAVAVAVLQELDAKNCGVTAAWSDASRKAALEARRRSTKNSGGDKSKLSDADKKEMVCDAHSYLSDAMGHAPSHHDIADELEANHGIKLHIDEIKKHLQK